MGPLSSPLPNLSAVFHQIDGLPVYPDSLPALQNIPHFQVFLF
jgi:hypothetical protein